MALVEQVRPQREADAYAEGSGFMIVTTERCLFF